MNAESKPVDPEKEKRKIKAVAMMKDHDGFLIEPKRRNRPQNKSPGSPRGPVER
jgi:hypothetical protein